MKRITIIVAILAVLLTACSSKTQITDNSGMNHEAGHGGQSTIKPEDITATWTFTEETTKSAKEVGINIQIQDIENNPIDDFDISHEKKLHLIIVSKDFAYFHHIHPEYKGEGVFDIQTEFPAGGEYKLFADFIPSGGAAMTKSEWIKLEGDERTQAVIQPDSSLTKSVNGKEVTLSYGQLQAGEEVLLTFTIKDDQTKEPISNLEPYLGAVGHVVILTEDAEQYLHVHPLDEKASGPDALFATTFPQSGVYKIWGQFQHEGQAFTVPFVVELL